MSFLRHRQRAATALFPHANNRRFLIPNRGRIKTLGFAVGDSNTQGAFAWPGTYGGTDPTKYIKTAEVANYGVGGKDLTQIYNDQFSVAIKEMPRAGFCFITGGTNDFERANDGNWAPRLQTMKDMVMNMVNDSFAVGLFPIVMNTPPVYPGNQADPDGVDANMVKPYNTWIRDPSGPVIQSGATFIDQYAAVQTPASDPGTILMSLRRNPGTDTIHLSKKDDRIPGSDPWGMLVIGDLADAAVKQFQGVT